MKISKLQSLFRKYFVDNMNETWLIEQIKKLPEKQRTPKLITTTFNTVYELAKKYPYQYCLGAMDQWWYQDLGCMLNKNFRTEFRYNNKLL